MKSIVLAGIVSMALVLGLAACKHGGDHPHGDHSKTDQPKKSDHPSNADHPQSGTKSDHPDHPH